VEGQIYFLISCKVIVLRKIFFFILLSFIAVPLAFQKASANELNIGATFLYNQWAPVWNNRKIIIYPPPYYFKFKDTHAPHYSDIRQYKYGPDLSITFMHCWEFISSFKYGIASTNGANLSVMPDPINRKITINVTQYDTYASIGYFLHEYLKIFGGLRFELYKYSMSYKHMQFLPIELIIVPIKGKLLNFSPEIGLHVCLPITHIFHFLINFSWIFQSGSDKIKFKIAYSTNGSLTMFPNYPTGRYYAVGFNLSPAFRVHIPKINTFLTIGGYYRLLRYIQKSSEQSLFNINNALDQNFGFTCSLSYCFNFGERIKPRVWIPRPNYE
jgi:hypothetical protein